MSNNLAIIPTLNLSDVVGIAKVEFSRHIADNSPTAKITLKNGWVISLLSGSLFYADGDGTTFEVGLVHPCGQLDYSLNDDVWGYQTPEEVKEIIKKASALAPDAKHTDMGNLWASAEK